MEDPIPSMQCRCRWLRRATSTVEEAWLGSFDEAEDEVERGREGKPDPWTEERYSPSTNRLFVSFLFCEFPFALASYHCFGLLWFPRARGGRCPKSRVGLVFSCRILVSKVCTSGRTLFVFCSEGSLAAFVALGLSVLLFARGVVEI